MDNKGLILLIVIVGIVLFVTGIIKLPQQTTTTTPSSGAKCPSDLKTSITLNTKDGLAASATNANASYYVLKSDGSFYKEGTTSAGTVSFDVQCGGSYKLKVYDDDGTAPDYYPIEKDFTANADEGSIKTINIDLDREGEARVEKVRDPVDLDSNLSFPLGATVAFDLVYKVNLSNSAFYNVGIQILVNESSVQDIDSVSDDVVEITCPRRLSTPGGWDMYCFEGKTAYSKGGIVTTQFNAKASTSVATAASGKDQINITLMDKSMYRDPDYATKGEEAFHINYENKNDNTNVGAIDSVAVVNAASIYLIA